MASNRSSDHDALHEQERAQQEQERAQQEQLQEQQQAQLEHNAIPLLGLNPIGLQPPPPVCYANPNANRNTIMEQPVLRMRRHPCGRDRLEQQRARAARLEHDNMSDDGVFLIPADDASCTAPDSVRQLTPAELEQMHARTAPAPLPAILYTASVLVHQRRCPVDVVNSILAFAGLFATFESETHARIDGDDNMDEEYVRLAIPHAEALELPAGVAVAQCVSLVVECESKDQGWASSDRELNGTYIGSYTWLDVSIQRPNGASSSATSASPNASAAADATAAPATHVEPAGAIEIRAMGSIDRHEPQRVDQTTVDAHDEHDDAAAAAAISHTDAIEVERVCAFPNVRASSRFRHHIKSYVHPQGLIASIALGDVVRLLLRSMYPGWRNSARFARVVVQFTLELNEDFSSATIACPDASTGADVNSSAD